MKASLRVAAAPLLLIASLAAEAADFAGVLVWRNPAALGMPVSGVIDEVHVQPGQWVKAGTPLVTLDDRVIKARQAEAAAAVTHATLLHEEAGRELARTQDLYDRTLIADHELQTATIGEAEAALVVARAEATKAKADFALEHSVLKAPAAGWVLERHAHPGQAISSRLQVPTLIVFAPSNTLVARVPVSGDALSGLRRGSAVSVTVNGADIRGKVLSVGATPSSSLAGSAPMFPVDIAVSGKDLHAGDPVRLSLP